MLKATQLCESPTFPIPILQNAPSSLHPIIPLKSADLRVFYRAFTTFARVRWYVHIIRFIYLTDYFRLYVLIYLLLVYFFCNCMVSLSLISLGIYCTLPLQAGTKRRGRYFLFFPLKHSQNSKQTQDWYNNQHVMSSSWGLCVHSNSMQKQMNPLRSWYTFIAFGLIFVPYCLAVHMFGSVCCLDRPYMTYPRTCLNALSYSLFNLFCHPPLLSPIPTAYPLLLNMRVTSWNIKGLRFPIKQLKILRHLNH